jgi:hypothetical protein
MNPTTASLAAHPKAGAKAAVAATCPTRVLFVVLCQVLGQLQGSASGLGLRVKMTKEQLQSR